MNWAVTITASAIQRRRSDSGLAATLAVVLAAHVGSPDVFFSGTAGPYAIRVVVRPPEVVPGVARVTVHTPARVERVSIRPVFWRAGTRGSPSADEMRKIDGSDGSATFEGSLWLMARGAYGVDVIVEGGAGRANVLVPVPSVATGRLPLSPALGALLVVLGVVLVAGLINIVYKGAGESLVEPGASLDTDRKRSARRAAAIATPILALAVFGGARWWGAVDRGYERTIYHPSPLAISTSGRTLHVAASDTIWQARDRPSGYLPDHGKLMHLFLVEAADARAFAHLHPQPMDTSAVPAFETRLPTLPSGEYRVFADVVHETGFERTLVGTLAIDSAAIAGVIAPLDPDDAFHVGEPTRDSITRLADGSTMRLEVAPHGVIRAGREETLRISVTDPSGRAVVLEPYLGMSAHAVVVRADGEVYVHLHSMGTVSSAAREAFATRDRGDTTADGRLRLTEPAPMASHQPSTTAEFPYAFPRPGNYRVFVQVKHGGQIRTGAYALTVSERAPTP